MVGVIFELANNRIAKGSGDFRRAYVVDADEGIMI